MNHTPEKPKYPPLEKVKEEREGLVKILENNFGSVQKIEVEVPRSKEVVEEVVKKEQNGCFNKINEKLEEEHGYWSNGDFLGKYRKKKTFPFED